MRHEVSTLKPNISTQTPDAEEKLQKLKKNKQTAIRSATVFQKALTPTASHARLHQNNWL